MAKEYSNIKNADGENVIIERDTETKQEKVFKTFETKESIIKKSLVAQEIKDLLLELFK